MGARRIRVPRRDQGIYDVLSRAFRNGDIYSFSFDGNVWSTWDTEHDWLGTFRNGRKLCGCEGTCEYGPIDWDRDVLAEWLGLAQPRTPAGLSKAQLVARLREIADELPPSALAVLDAA